ncbi:FAD:protein FMN transferase [Amnibacterium endophyticum]|uniref:FAD:protein FMN transferase n=1 Tax=Amnibacterium endophyticum TaxID=2109337 RepID=A0ABW4LHS9_9MICO
MPVVLAGERIAFDAIGTTWHLTTDRPIEPPTRARIDALVARYDRTWSRFRPDSAVNALAATGGPVDLGDEAAPLLGLLAQLRDATDGAMDPLVAASLEHLGYDADVRLHPLPGHRPAPSSTVEVAGSSVRATPPALLDVGSAGKGQLADLVARELVAAGHDRHVVDGSGDLVVAGPPVRVALEHPFDPAAAVGVVEVADGAIAGSAANRRAWQTPDGRRLHHVLDARTGAPVESIAATWALADDAMTADALATALFLVPPDALEERFDFRWVRMRTDGRISASAGIRGELFR